MINPTNKPIDSRPTYANEGTIIGGKKVNFKPLPKDLQEGQHTIQIPVGYSISSRKEDDTKDAKIKNGTIETISGKQFIKRRPGLLIATDATGVPNSPAPPFVFPWTPWPPIIVIWPTLDPVDPIVITPTLTHGTIISIRNS